MPESDAVKLSQINALTFVRFQIRGEYAKMVGGELQGNDVGAVA